MPISTQWYLSQGAPERYHRVLEPAIMAPCAEALVRRTEIRRGEVVVDVGCGTGAAARLAAERVGPNGGVIGIDVNPGMLDVARSVPSTEGAAIEWREADAAQLPLPTHSADLVLFAQSLQHLKDRRAALTDARRVLRPEGRLAISIWCGPEENPYLEALHDSVAAALGPEIVKGLTSSLSFANTGELRQLLAESDFKRVVIMREELRLPLGRLEDFIPRHISATPAAAAFADAPMPVQSAIARRVTDRLKAGGWRVGEPVPFRARFAFAARIEAS